MKMNLPMEMLELGEDEMFLLKGGNGPDGIMGGNGCGCGCSCGSLGGVGCGCGCNGGSGCGCGCSCGQQDD